MTSKIDLSLPSSGAAELAACPQCGTLQHRPAQPAGPVVRCAVCRSQLERRSGCNPSAALACAAAALLLLVPANLLPFLTTSVAGVSRQSLLGSSVRAMLGDGYPELAVVIGLFVVALPIVRLSLLAAVLSGLRFGWRSTWLGPAFRQAEALQTWAMPDVLLLAFVVAWSRLRATASVEIGSGALCFIAAAVLSLLTRATLDVPAVWRAIGDRRVQGPVPAAGTGSTLISCSGCERLAPAALAGARCPRCAARLHARRPAALARTCALASAAALLYVPANLYPMAALPIDFRSVKYTVLEGVIDLFDAHLAGLALLVLFASFVIPLLKLAGLAWCMLSVVRRSNRRLIAKTRLYELVEEIGRWSMVDPLVIACFVPVTQYSAWVHGAAGPAAPAFAAVVILTTLAARSFDPRLMWDAARRRR